MGKFTSWNIGVVFGGYCPMHQGHFEAILKAKKECRNVFVVVCGYDNEPRAKELGLTHEERVKLITDYFKGDEVIQVISVNDDELHIDQSESDSNWRIWVRAVRKQIFEFCDSDVDGDELFFYVGEQRYYDAMKRIWNGRYNIPILVGLNENGERINDISATKLREHPQKYWNKILPPFKEKLTKRILITGTASEGKTTMVKDLARYFQCPYTTEYGRDYMEARNMKDPDLGFEDFLNFIVGQNQYYYNALKSPANNGIIISDTDNLVTLMYAKAYVDNSEMKINGKDYLALYNCVEQCKDNITWDKIFVLPPTKGFVDDGSRYMGQASLSERQANFDKLMKLIEDFGLMDKVEVLYSDFSHNFQHVKEYIESLYV
jgi:NadR type nicotinamide-nucleotide adenylyltransferase